MEGGSVDFNGNGTLLTTTACLLNKNRNPKLSKARLEAVLKENLGCKTVVWLKDGIEGDDTDGHIDDFCRFAPDGAVLLAEEPGKGENARRLAENGRLLSSACDANGWELLRLPMPKTIIDPVDKRKLPASYANFYIGNRVVLCPIFKDKNDDAAQEIVESCFPGREVVPVFSRDIVYGYGGIHCITQQQPKVRE